MSYYFCIIGTKDNPLFEYEFGTSRQSGDGQAHFPPESRHLNQFVVHSSLDVVDEVQFSGGQMYLKCIDKFQNNFVSCFLTGGNIKFMFLHLPTAPQVAGAGRAATAIAANPTSAAAEEAIRQFFVDVYEAWVKTIMNPFYQLNMPVTSPVFRSRVAAAGKKYL